VYLLTDHLGTPRQGILSSGKRIWRWNSDAFGKSAPEEDPDNDGTSTTINLRFAGQYYDAESGEYYNYFRYYDAKTGRYVTSDPIGIDGGNNTYGYVKSSPLMSIDPLGLKKFPCPPGTVAPGVSCTIDDGVGNGPGESKCAIGSPDCFLLNGPSPENSDQNSIEKYNKFGNNLCYSTCMQDEKGEERKLCKLAKKYPLFKYACKAKELYLRHNNCMEKCFPSDDYGCFDKY